MEEEKKGKAPAKATFTDQFMAYYKSVLIPKVMDEEEFNRMIEVYKTQLPIVLRVATWRPESKKIVDEFLQIIEDIKKEGFDCEELTYIPNPIGRIFKISMDKATSRKDPRFNTFKKWKNLYNRLGAVHQQEFVSMVPPFFLDVKGDVSVLDTCAAPGSKTAQIIESLGEKGFVVANDSDIKRVHPLIHQLQRVGTSKVLVITHLAQNLPDLGVQFDRVLCDVPCTGDGTIRKNPVAASKWHVKSGAQLHHTQRLILRRGLEMTKVGGRVVYSTCSMSPLEDEAVVNSVLRDCGGSVVIEDVSSMYPELKRHNGLTDWPVYDSNMDELTLYESYEKVPESRRQFAAASFFPHPQVEGLERTMRFFPHDQDSGGFYVAVLRKVSEIPPPAEEPRKKKTTEKKPLKEEPYLPMDEAMEKEVSMIKETFGLKEGFPTQCLFVRGTKSRTITYAVEPLADLIRAKGSQSIRTVGLGEGIFSMKPFGKDKQETTCPTLDGLSDVMKFATKRIFDLTPSDVLRMLYKHPDAVGFNMLDEASRKQFEGVTTNGAVVRVPGTLFAYPAMAFEHSVAVYLNKDLVILARENIVDAYPELEPLSKELEAAAAKARADKEAKKAEEAKNKE